MANNSLCQRQADHGFLTISHAGENVELFARGTEWSSGPFLNLDTLDAILDGKIKTSAMLGGKSLELASQLIENRRIFLGLEKPTI